MRNHRFMHLFGKARIDGVEATGFPQTETLRVSRSIRSALWCTLVQR